MYQNVHNASAMECERTLFIDVSVTFGREAPRFVDNFSGFLLLFFQ